MRDHLKCACFTICSNNYVPAAAVLTSSLRQHHGEFDLFLCLVDTVDESVRYPDCCTVVGAADIGISRFDLLSFRYGVLELNTAVKPFMFLWLLEQGYDAVLYFDPDIKIFAPLSSVLDPLRSGASFVLTPHLCSPAEEWSPRTDIDIMQTGVFNLGFAACGRHPETEPVLRWWGRRLRERCVIDTANGIFVDQKFMDLVPGFAAHTHILHDTTCNIAYWNLAQRRLERDGETWLVDGRPLTFFHFSGFNPTDLDCISKYASFEEDQVPADLTTILSDYADELLANGFVASKDSRYGFGSFASGTPVPELVRRMFREQHRDWWGDPFSNYEQFLQLPHPDSCAESPAFLVTNLMRFIYDCRGDLRDRFNLRTRDGVEGFARWYLDHAAHDFGVSRHLIEPVAVRAGFAGTASVSTHA